MRKKRGRALAVFDLINTLWFGCKSMTTIKSRQLAEFHTVLCLFVRGYPFYYVEPTCTRCGNSRIEYNNMFSAAQQHIYIYIYTYHFRIVKNCWCSSISSLSFSTIRSKVGFINRMVGYNEEIPLACSTEFIPAR